MILLFLRISWSSLKFISKDPGVREPEKVIDAIFLGATNSSFISSLYGLGSVLNQGQLPGLA